MNFNNKTLYFIGLKGVGMTALAQILKAMGANIVGSDITDIFFTDKVIKKENFTLYEGFSENNLTKQKIDLIIYSTAYNQQNNPEMDYATRNNLPMFSYPEIVAQLFNENHGIAICGSHGKTTITAMLGIIFKEAGLEPKALIGGRLPQIESNALTGASKYFILEADEYQKKFLKYEPQSIIVTHIDWDHPDTFPTEKDYVEAFDEFLNKLPQEGMAVGYADDKFAPGIFQKLKCHTFTYGLNNNANFYATDINMVGATTFNVWKNQEKLGEIVLQIPGKHNILNSLASIAMSMAYNIKFSDIQKALKEFQGVERRIEFKGEKNGALIYDDYAHHPTEIKASLNALRLKYPTKQILGVFHPHTFTRTATFLNDFSESFTDADKVVVLDIYASARETAGTVTSQDLVNLINKISPDKTQHIPTIAQASEILKKELNNNLILVTIGAGDVWKLGENVLR